MSYNGNGTQPGGTGIGAGNNLTLTPEEIAAITAARQQFAAQQNATTATADASAAGRVICYLAAEERINLKSWTFIFYQSTCALFSVYCSLKL